VLGATRRKSTLLRMIAGGRNARSRPFVRTVSYVPLGYAAGRQPAHDRRRTPLHRAHQRHDEDERLAFVEDFSNIPYMDERVAIQSA